MRRINGILLVGLITALSAAVFVASAAAALATIARSAGGPEAAQADSHCNYRVYAPTDNYSLTTHSSRVVANASFSCTTVHPNSTATVLMERFSNGSPNNVASKTKRLYVRAGMHYTVQSNWQPVIHCGGLLTTLKMRTHFVLKLNGKLFIDYTTPAVKVSVNCS